MKRIETIAIGDELLDGRITDTNASSLARILSARGLTVGTMSVVADDPVAIVEALERGAQRSDVLVCSGGLGPTEDDRTRHAAAMWTGTELVRDDKTLEQMRRRLASVGFEMTPNNLQQVLFPAGSTVLETEVGTAAGFSISPRPGQVAYFFPGVPHEYRWFVERYVVEAVAASEESARQTLIFFGLGESTLEDRLGAADLPRGVRVGYRAHFPEIHVTISASGEDSAVRVQRAVDLVLTRLGRFLVGRADEGLAKRVGRLLTGAGRTVTTIESCTGGLAAELLTREAGASAYFRRGLVTYSNDAKVALAGVHSETLEEHGAVSEAVAREMAAGGREAAGADYALAVTGIAGPSGGSPEKPVGTVYIALDSARHSVAVKVAMRPRWGRQRIRQASAYHALSLLLKELEDRLDDDPRVRVIDAPRAHGGVLP